MKSVVFVICFIVLFTVVACTGKKEVAGVVAKAIDLTGTWELREAQNGMMPNKEYPAGDNNRLQFTATTFEQYDSGELARSGNYSLVRDTTVIESVGLELPEEKFNHRIIFSNDTTEKAFVDLRGDTLEILSGFFPVDGGSRRIYVRRKGDN